MDAADILPVDAETSLDRELRKWFDETGNVLVVSSVPTLSGRTIEDVAHEQFSDWGIGDARTDRGLLILVAPNERKVRIEVGCGLERVITDAMAAKVVQNDIIPAFRAGDMVNGVEKGTKSLMAQTDANIAKAKDGPLSPICREHWKEAA